MSFPMEVRLGLGGVKTQDAEYDFLFGVKKNLIKCLIKI